MPHGCETELGSILTKKIAVGKCFGFAACIVRVFLPKIQYEKTSGVVRAGGYMRQR